MLKYVLFSVIALVVIAGAAGGWHLYRISARNAKVTGYQSFNNMGKEYDTAVDNKISAWLNGL